MISKKTLHVQPRALASSDWEDYALLDSGKGRKLERFGQYCLIRPEPKALWNPTLPARTWDAAHAHFEVTRKTGDGEWHFRSPVTSPWTLRYKALTFQVQLTSSRHLGVFPENAVHWDWIEAQVTAVEQPVQVLNLFGYTGLATLAAVHAGAKVTHVDAAAQAVRLARANQSLSGLAERPIRWIVDDALKFTRREERRGVKYDGIIMDPPKFGRGPKGEVWEFTRSFADLCQVCRAVLSDVPRFIVITAYTPQASVQDLQNALSGMVQGFGGLAEVGELTTVEQSAGHTIPEARYARWAAGGGG